eukprot:1141552-Pelagomonas_calceolata.AAC.1
MRRRAIKQGCRLCGSGKGTRGIAASDLLIHMVTFMVARLGSERRSRRWAAASTEGCCSKNVPKTVLGQG